MAEMIVGRGRSDKKSSAIGAPSAIQSAYSPLENVWADTSRQYNDIIDAYRKSRSEPTQITRPTPYSFTPLSSQARTPELSNAFNLYQNFANTGGYSGGDVQNIRARSLSPIRAIYANANREVDRQKNLQGGYSPNYGAVKSKMARELSSILGDKSTDVEAQIAQMVQSGKAQALPGLAGLAESQAGREQQINLANQQQQMQTEQMNMAALRDYEERLRAQQGDTLQNIQAEQSLYGTSPAIASTFGNQFLNTMTQPTMPRRVAGSDIKPLTSMYQGAPAVAPISRNQPGRPLSGIYG